MSEFRETSFGDLVGLGVLTIGDGYRAKLEELGGDGPAFLRAGALTDIGFDLTGLDHFHVSTGIFREKVTKLGDTVITTKGNGIGRVGYIGSADLEGLVYSPHLSFWRSCDRGQLDARFLNYWARGPQFASQLRGLAFGTDMAPYLSLIDQRRLNILLPPIDYQRDVTAVLGALDDKIDLNRRMNDSLDSLARAIVKRASLADSVPVACSDLATVNASTLRGSIPWETIEYVDIGSVWRGQIAEATLVAAEAAPSRARRLAIDGDTALSTVRPDRGAYCLIRDPSASLVLSTGFAIIRPINRWASPLLYCLLTDPVAMSRYGQVADGGAYPAIRPRVIQEQELAWPNHAEDVAREIEQLFSLAAANGRESRSLATLRDALLPKLVSGELRIAEAQGIVEATM